MNKTININLGGYFFHIDESAYQKLRRYLDAIARSLSEDPQGKNEIIADIEARISELLSEKITDARQVVNDQDISDIIKIMGEPEDYADSEESYTDTKYQYSKRSSNSKKLFRDGDDKFIGGVASGIGHYCDIDVIWIRLAFILTAVFTGFGFLAYILFWILLPEAKTTAEKLQMEGEDVNINNIEKKIREEFTNVKENIKKGAESVSEKFSNAEKKYKPKAKSGFQEFLDTLGNILTVFFKIIGKFIGVLIIIVSASVLISFVLAIFSIGSFEILGFGDEFTELPPFMESSMLPHWLLAMCIIVLVGFPFLILFVLGLRILSSNIKQFSKTTSLTLLGIWIVALLMVIFTGIEFGTSNAFRSSDTVTKELYIQQNDTLNVNFKKDEDLISDRIRVTRGNQYEVIIDDEVKLYSNAIRINVKESDNDSPYIKIKKTSEGRNRKLARKNAQVIDYKYNLNGQDLDLYGYIIKDVKDRFKYESIYITLFVPEGMTIYFDESSKYFINNIENIQDIYDRDMIEHYFEMTKEGLNCTDCEEEKEEETKEKTNLDTIN